MKRDWRLITDSPDESMELLLYFGKGLIVSGEFLKEDDGEIFMQYGVSQNSRPTHWCNMLRVDDEL